MNDAAALGNGFQCCEASDYCLDDSCRWNQPYPLSCTLFTLPLLLKNQISKPSDMIDPFNPIDKATYPTFYTDGFYIPPVCPPLGTSHQ